MTQLANDDAGMSGIGPLEALVGYHLRRASSVFGADFMEAMEGTGLRQVLFAILAVVDAQPGISQGAAGRLLGIQRANMVSLINELVELGLVDRQIDTRDRRAFAISVTAAGKAALADGLRRVRAHEDRLLKKLSSNEQRTLISLLSRIFP